MTVRPSTAEIAKEFCDFDDRARLISQENRGRRFGAQPRHRRGQGRIHRAARRRRSLAPAKDRAAAGDIRSRSPRGGARLLLVQADRRVWTRHRATLVAGDRRRRVSRAFEAQFRLRQQLSLPAKRDRRPALQLRVARRGQRRLRGLAVTVADCRGSPNCLHARVPRRLSVGRGAMSSDPLRMARSHLQMYEITRRDFPGRERRTIEHQLTRWRAIDALLRLEQTRSRGRSGELTRAFVSAPLLVGDTILFRRHREHDPARFLRKKSVQARPERIFGFACLPDWLQWKMVLPVRIELTTSALPRMRSTTELRQHFCGGGRAYDGPRLGLSSEAKAVCVTARRTSARNGSRRHCGKISGAGKRRRGRSGRISRHGSIDAPADPRHAAQMRFVSDNAAAAHPRVIEAIAASNRLDSPTTATSGARASTGLSPSCSRPMCGHSG